jgi:hypothetical protein
MRLDSGPPYWRRGVGCAPTSHGGLSKDSLRKYTPTWNKSIRRTGLVSVRQALSDSSWSWLLGVCNGGRLT